MINFWTEQADDMKARVNSSPRFKLSPSFFSGSICSLFRIFEFSLGDVRKAIVNDVKL